MNTKSSFVTKDQFVALLRESGVTDGQMQTWHRLFERRHPEEHGAFLRALQIDETGIDKIRQASRS